MHSEISIRFRDDVDPSRMLVGMADSSDPEEVLKQSYLKSDTDLLSNVAYSHIESSCLYLAFVDDDRSFRVHLESRRDRGNLKKLVLKSEEVAERFLDQAKRAGYRHKSVRISLFSDEYSDEYLITTGLRLSFFLILWRRFADTIYWDVAIAVLSVLFTKQWTEAGIAGMAAFLSILLWLVIELKVEGEIYDYERF